MSGKGGQEMNWTIFITIWVVIGIILSIYYIPYLKRMSSDKILLLTEKQLQLYGLLMAIIFMPICLFMTIEDIIFESKKDKDDN